MRQLLEMHVREFGEKYLWADGDESSSGAQGTDLKIVGFLAGLLSDGQQLASKLPYGKETILESEIAEWRAKTVEYIGEKLGCSYVIQFGTQSGNFPMGPFFVSEVSRLNWVQLQFEFKWLNKWMDDARKNQLEVGV